MKIQQTTTEIAAQNPVKSSSAASHALRYYIHDHSHAFRLQLVGNFSKSDVPELDGCWTTARRSVAKRKVRIDLVGLTEMDAAACEWLLKMSHIEGVEFIAPPHLALELPKGSVVEIRAPAVERPRGWQAISRLFVHERRPSVLYQVATDSPSQSG